MSSTPCQVPEILLPSRGTDLKKWAVIACDQYTSEPEYWEECEREVGDAPSTLRVVLPEVKLGTKSQQEIDAELRKISSRIREYTESGIWGEPVRGFILTDRSTSLHPSRRGIMLAINLDDYSYEPGNKALIRATEGTVLSRIPPRVRIRANAQVELPHIMLLYDDPEDKVIRNAMSSCPEIIYDTDLMQNSGHISGRLIEEGSSAASGIIRDFKSLVSSDGLLFAVGDGNHSLAAAKAHWENIKKELTEAEQETHPGRFALAEAVNIHDEGLDFEPIHRVIFDVTKERFLEILKNSLRDSGFMTGEASEDAQSFTVIGNGEDITVSVADPPHTLAVGTVQQIIDKYGLKCDYIHGEDSVRKLAEENNTGILLPAISKDSFFRTIETEGVFPRKTFSMGEAFEKRFYLEARRITL